MPLSVSEAGLFRMPLSTIISISWTTSNLAAAILIVRLAYLGLFRRYLAFSLLILLDLLMGGFGSFFGVSSSIYCQVFWWAQTVYLALDLLVVREIFADLFLEYPGLRDLAQKPFRQSVAIGALLAGASLFLGRHAWTCPGFQCKFFEFLEMKRFFVSGLIAFTPLMMIRLSAIPSVRLNTNTVLNAWVFNIFLLNGVATGLVVFIWHRPEVLKICNCVLLATNIGCFTAWMTGLRRPEEAARPAEIVVDQDPKIVADQIKSFTSVCENLLRKRDRPNPSTASKGAL
jgi:hypothetical protein